MPLTLMRCTLVVFVAVLLAVSGSSSPQPKKSPGPAARITYPRNGARITMDTPAQFKASYQTRHWTGTVTVSMDGLEVLRHDGTTGVQEVMINVPAAGTHTLVVSMLNVEGSTELSRAVFDVVAAGADGGEAMAAMQALPLASTAAVKRPPAVGKKYFFALPADANRTVWMHGFNMQSHILEELAHLALISNRTLIEPRFNLGIRNWTWFESQDNNAKRGYGHILQGILGFQNLPLSHFFDIAPFQKELPGGVEKLETFRAKTGGYLDAYVRFLPHDETKIPKDDPCHWTKKQGGYPHGLEVEWNGEQYHAERLICMEEGARLDDLTGLLRDDSIQTVAVHYLPMKYMEWRQPDWKVSGQRARVRRLFNWAPRLMAKAQRYIDEKFNGEDFMAVHWRRGDRAYRAEMSIDGFIDTILSSPDAMTNMVMDLQEQHHIQHVFLATNCGNKQELQSVIDQLDAVMYEGSGDWSLSAEEAVLEQIIGSMAKIYVTPPGLGMPHDVNATSNFSTWVVEQRSINGLTGDHYVMCCGTTTTVMGVYHPINGVPLPKGEDVNVTVFAAFVPYTGRGVMVFEELGVRIPVNESGFLLLRDVPEGTHSITVEIVDAEDAVISPKTASTQLVVGNADAKVTPGHEIWALEHYRDYTTGDGIPSDAIGRTLHKNKTRDECHTACKDIDECIAWTWYSHRADELSEQTQNRVDSCVGLMRGPTSAGDEVLPVDIGEGRRSRHVWTGVRWGVHGAISHGRWTRCMPTRGVCLMMADPQ